MNPAETYFSFCSIIHSLRKEDRVTYFLTVFNRNEEGICLVFIFAK